jgi:hypothetical protein
MDTPQRRVQYLKQVLVEWIVTNGSLPGFQDRVNASKPYWKLVPPEGMTVYRGQGHSKPGIPNHGDPTTLVDGTRPILATTKSMETAKQYMGTECCLFEIQVTPGIRYVDAKELFTFPDRETGQTITNVSNETIDNVLNLVGPMNDSYWLKKAVAEGNGRNAVRSVFLKRIHEEDEILFDGSQGGFVVTPHMFKAKYIRKGRGRTFRTKALRRNKKNGYRPSRKSQNRRNR